jgi:hypothetical protein
VRVLVRGDEAEELYRELLRGVRSTGMWGRLVDRDPDIVKVTAYPGGYFDIHVRWGRDYAGSIGSGHCFSPGRKTEAEMRALRDAIATRHGLEAQWEDRT